MVGVLPDNAYFYNHLLPSTMLATISITISIKKFLKVRSQHSLNRNEIFQQEQGSLYI